MAAFDPSGNGIKNQIRDPHRTYANDESRGIHGCNLFPWQGPVDSAQIKESRLRQKGC